MSPQFDLEEVYDEQISPSMTKIIAICKEHNLPMLATFFYARHGEDDEALCTTALLGREFAARAIPENLLEAHRAITRRAGVHMFQTTVIKGDESKEVTMHAVVDGGRK